MFLFRSCFLNTSKILFPNSIWNKYW